MPKLPNSQTVRFTVRASGAGRDVKAEQLQGLGQLDLFGEGVSADQLLQHLRAVSTDAALGTAVSLQGACSARAWLLVCSFVCFFFFFCCLLACLLHYAVADRHSTRTDVVRCR